MAEDFEKQLADRHPLAPVPAIHDMIESAFIPNARFAGHDLTLSAQLEAVNEILQCSELTPFDTVSFMRRMRIEEQSINQRHSSSFFSAGGT